MEQCKTIADLYREYARVIDMCEGAKMNPWQCVKYGSDTCATRPSLDCIPDRYRFALAIVEGKPVFPGDLLYNSNTKKKHFIDGVIDKNHDDWSWNPPQPKKLVLNGVEFPMQCDDSTVHVTIPFDNIDLANQFRKQFFDLVANQKDSK